MSRQSDRRLTLQLVADLEQKDWRIEGDKHIKAYCPCGRHMLVLPRTPSDPRSIDNTRSLIKRFLKDCAGSASGEGEA